MFKEMIEKLGSRNKETKERFKEAQAELKIQKTIEDRQKSSNERELERYVHEEREKEIKLNLEQFRKKRQHEDSYGHNPLNIKNVTNKCDWEVLKEKPLFTGGNMFKNQKRVY